MKWTQWELQKAGFNVKKYGGIDGIFGNGTYQYVKEFQRSYKLTADGIVGPKTIEAFLKN